MIATAWDISVSGRLVRKQLSRSWSILVRGSVWRKSRMIAFKLWWPSICMRVLILGKRVIVRVLGPILSRTWSRLWSIRMAAAQMILLRLVSLVLYLSILGMELSLIADSALLPFFLSWRRCINLNCWPFLSSWLILLSKWSLISKLVVKVVLLLLNVVSTLASGLMNRCFLFIPGYQASFFWLDVLEIRWQSFCLMSLKLLLLILMSSQSTRLSVKRLSLHLWLSRWRSLLLHFRALCFQYMIGLSLLDLSRWLPYINSLLIKILLPAHRHPCTSNRNIIACAWTFIRVNFFRFVVGSVNLLILSYLLSLLC